MPTLVKAHIPRLRKPEDLRDAAGVDEVGRVDEWRHRGERSFRFGSVRADP
jgi:hypothetical protein